MVGRVLTFVFVVLFILGSCAETKDPAVENLKQKTELDAVLISYIDFIDGNAPEDFSERTGAAYKPSYNENPALPPQCWAETGSGTQNSCQICHTDYLAETGHGNRMETAGAQVVYRFSSPDLNRMNWVNLIHPDQISTRLEEEGLSVPAPGDPDNLDYVRRGNWMEAYLEGRFNGDVTWNNISNKLTDARMIPALNPAHLHPKQGSDPTDGGTHGYMDADGFVHDETEQLTGWRAVNFYPYPVYTPVSGTVSGVYIRLPREFMTAGGRIDAAVYHENLQLLEKNIKNLPVKESHYLGDAQERPIKKGRYPVGTEFIQTLHYVDLNADHEIGDAVDGVAANDGLTYEFPGTRSKRLKEIRFMYKWQSSAEAGSGLSGAIDPNTVLSILGEPGKGWIDSKAGWIMAAFIENREGRLRPQTTEEMVQCIGCHTRTGNTIDSVWSFQRKLPGDNGWGEMNYGGYSSDHPEQTRLPDYLNDVMQTGEKEYFLTAAASSDLFGNLSNELKADVMQFAEKNGWETAIVRDVQALLDDTRLRKTGHALRKQIMQERRRLLRRYAEQGGYLMAGGEKEQAFIKGAVFYPEPDTVRTNIALYRRIVLDQSFNLGKYVFGYIQTAVPMNFISDGTIQNADGELIPAGDVFLSRPYGEDGIGKTPTGLVEVNENGRPVDADGRVVDISANPEQAAGHIQRGGVFFTRYCPIISQEFRKMPEKQ